MAPEYVITGQFSAKSDVYSFGMIVLEIVSGQKNKFCSQSHDEESLIHRVSWNFCTIIFSMFSHEIELQN